MRSYQLIAVLFVLPFFAHAADEEEEVVFSSDYRLYEDAKAFCESLGRKLWAPTTKEEMQALTSNNPTFEDNVGYLLAWNDLGRNDINAPDIWKDEDTGEQLPEDTDIWRVGRATARGCGVYMINLINTEGLVADPLSCVGYYGYPSVGTACQKKEVAEETESVHPDPELEPLCQDYNWKCNKNERWGSNPAEHCDEEKVQKRCPRLCGLCNDRE